MSSSKIPVTIQVIDNQGQIEVVDGNFCTVDQGFGTLQTALAPGIYKARAIIGDAEKEELFIVEPSARKLDLRIEPIRFSTPIPLQDSSTSHERHQTALVDATSAPALDMGLGEGATLLVQLRDHGDVSFSQQHASPGMQPEYSESFRGLRLRSASGALLLDLDLKAEHEPERGYSILNLQLRPGPYILSYEPTGSNSVAMPILAVSGWQTQVFFHVRMPAHLDAPGYPDLSDRAIVMAPAGMRFFPGDHQLRLTEIARYALTQSRVKIPPAYLEKQFVEKLNFPLLGVFACHLLLKEAKSHSFLATLIDNVAGLIGSDFPDVIALRIALAEREGRAHGTSLINDLRFTPLLSASADILSRHANAMSPDSIVGEAISRMIPHGAWFSWEPPAHGPRATAVRFAIGDHLTVSRDEATIFRSLSNMLLNAKEGLIRAIINEGFARYGRNQSGQNEVSAALNITIAIARQVKWDLFFKYLRSTAENRGLFSDLTALQRSLIPTLHLIHLQLEDGDDFTIEEFQQICEGLGVPVSVLHGSLEDLARKLIRLDSEFLVDDRQEPV